MTVISWCCKSTLQVGGRITVGLLWNEISVVGHIPQYDMLWSITFSLGKKRRKKKRKCPSPRGNESLELWPIFSIVPRSNCKWENNGVDVSKFQGWITNEHGLHTCIVVIVYAIWRERSTGMIQQRTWGIFEDEFQSV